MYFTATFPYILLTILLIRTSLLDGAGDGIDFYVKPDFDRLTKMQVNTLCDCCTLNTSDVGRIHTGSGSVPDSCEPYASGRLCVGFAFTLQTTDPPRTVRAHFAVYTLRLLRDRL